MLYRKVYTGFEDPMTGEPIYNLEEVEDLYTIAEEGYENQSGGPGASSTKVLKICPMGAYHTGKFPPLFQGSDKRLRHHRCSAVDVCDYPTRHLFSIHK